MMRHLLLTICFIVLVKDVLTVTEVTEDELLDETVVEDQKGVDERAERLKARLEALREVEEELVDFKEERRGGLGLAENLSQLSTLSSEVPNSSRGITKAVKKKGTPNDARELLARLKALEEQSRGFDSQEESLDSTLGRKAEGKKREKSDARVRLARLTEIKERSRGFGPQHTSQGDLNLILNKAGIGADKKMDGKERLKGLFGTLDALLFGRHTQGPRKANSATGSGADRFLQEHSSDLKVGPGRFKGRRTLSAFEEPFLGGLDLGSLAENVGQGGNVFLFLLSGSENPQFSINA